MPTDHRLLLLRVFLGQGHQSLSALSNGEVKPDTAYIRQTAPRTLDPPHELLLSLYMYY